MHVVLLWTFVFAQEMCRPSSELAVSMFSRLQGPGGQFQAISNLSCCLEI